MSSHSANRFYESLGVKKIINAGSWITVYGGSIMPSAVVQTMEEASNWFVDMHELNEKAGQFIADITGAEAGLVTAGSAAGMVLEAAACITGLDPAKAWSLPDTTGMKDEIIIQHAHRVNYDHNYRAAGARIIEVGNTGITEEWELESSINENTAAVAHIFGPRQDGAIPLPRVVKIAHDNGIPVIVDAAAMLPPPENLRRFIAEGADMVSFSGGKGVLGPQSTGILCGKRELIEAAYLSSAPNSTGIGRSAKVCKEEIAGLMTALKLFIDADHESIAANWRSKSLHVVSSLDGIVGLKVQLIEADYDALDSDLNYASAEITFLKEWSGPTRDEVVQALISGNPSIRVGVGDSFRPSIWIIPVNVRDGEEEFIVSRLIEVMKV